jgi:hypothetical protein
MTLANLRIVTCQFVHLNTSDRYKYDTKYYIEYADLNKLVISILKSHERSFTNDCHKYDRLQYLYVSQPTNVVPMRLTPSEETATIIKDWEHTFIYMSSTMYSEYVEKADAEYVFDVGPLSKTKDIYEIGPYVLAGYKSSFNWSLEQKVSTTLYRPNDYGPPEI